MSLLSDHSEIRPTVFAALLMLCRRLLDQLDLQLPETVAEIVDLAGCGTSQPYLWVERIEEMLEELGESRPAEDDSSNPTVEPALLEVACRVRDYLAHHPGAAERSEKRTTYSDSFRRFVLELRSPGQPGADLTVEQFAEATGVPFGTIKDWLKAAPLENPEEEPETSRDVRSTDPRIATILEAYERWEGTHSGFCDHLRAHHRIDASDTHIAHVLEAAGLREPNRRSRGRETETVGFTELFPGAQWTGDGSPMVVEMDGHPFAFNLEAIVDVDSNAIVGTRATPVENQKAVLEAFEQGETTTGAKPVGLSLDNRPSNHTAALEEAIDPSKLVPTTPGRPTSKAPVEGHFGLFEQSLPPVELQDAGDRESVARQLLELVSCAFARGRNGRPRSKLGDRSPAEVYREFEATDEEIQEAKEYVNQLRERQEKIRETRKRRADPERRKLLEEALTRLEIPDPDGRLADALAGFTKDAIVGGIGIFEGKKRAGTLPDDVDEGPYLSGIIKNEHNRLEQEAIAESLLEIRLRQRDLALTDLKQDREEILSASDPARRLTRAVDRALEADPLLDFRFYKSTAVEILSEVPIDKAEPLYTEMSRRIAATHQTSKSRRQALLTDLSAALETIP